jgi:hypothetical protein
MKTFAKLGMCVVLLAVIAVVAGGVAGYAPDNFYATFKKIELHDKNADTWVTVWTGTKKVDIQALNAGWDTAGISDLDVPAGTYDKARVTIDATAGVVVSSNEGYINPVKTDGGAENAGAAHAMPIADPTAAVESEFTNPGGDIVEELAMGADVVVTAGQKVAGTVDVKVTVPTFAYSNPGPGLHYYTITGDPVVTVTYTP